MEAWKIELYYGNDEIYHSELMHYGIKGQKWGIRRFQNEDGTFNEAGKQRYFGKGSGNKPVGRSLKAKVDKINAKKENVKVYSKVYDKAVADQERADAANREMKEAYNALGKTKISRIVQAYKGSIGKGSEAYKRYSKAYDKAVSTQEKADASGRAMREAYENTGKTYIGRILNNIKYGTHS